MEVGWSWDGGGMEVGLNLDSAASPWCEVLGTHLYPSGLCLPLLNREQSRVHLGCGELLVC